MSRASKMCQYCPYPLSSPVNPRDIFIGNEYFLFLGPACTHTSIQKLDDHPPFLLSKSQNILEVVNTTHTYAHCSRCNLILDYDVWGCGCKGVKTSDLGMGGRMHDEERVLYTPGRCNHCVKNGQEHETSCEPIRCIKCVEMKSDNICCTPSSQVVG
jgi:hypothetical protein